MWYSGFVSYCLSIKKKKLNFSWQLEGARGIVTSRASFAHVALSQVALLPVRKYIWEL